MKCPACSNPDTRVIDSREAEDGDSIRRRRVCDRCEERFTTFERSESARIQVLKRDGSRQEFDRRKLASAIGKAASKALSSEEIDRHRRARGRGPAEWRIRDPVRTDRRDGPRASRGTRPALV